jgi:class 3 adenylate cyclase
MSNLPTGTVSFLFTDIEGSTRLAQENPEKWEVLRERHHAILHSVINAQQGYIFHVIGDAFCVALRKIGGIPPSK